MKKILLIIALFIFLALTGVIAFLVTRPCDYRASFTIKTTPDIAYFNIINWDTWNRKHLGQNVEILEKIPVESISQKILLKDTTFVFNWKIFQLNDSVTMIRACVTDIDRKFYNRLTVPFFNTTFKKKMRGNLIDIKTKLEFMLKTFRYEFTGYQQFRGKSCVYLNVNSTARGKAHAMISNVTTLNQFVRQNNLELDGNPFVIIHEWKEGNDSINFDFCFPVTNNAVIPEHSAIKFKEVENMEAVKTDFYGNYSLTDITWHSLAEQAKRSGYQINNKIIEVYFNDPHTGGNELEWKAEIYLGIENKTIYE